MSSRPIPSSRCYTPLSKGYLWPTEPMLPLEAGWKHRKNSCSPLSSMAPLHGSPPSMTGWQSRGLQSSAAWQCTFHWLPSLPCASSPDPCTHLLCHVNCLSQNLCLNFCFGGGSTLRQLRWLILCVNLAVSQCPVIWSNTLLSVSVKVFFLDEINI